ncbi:flagellar rod assembly protein/muramidase FlgJ [Chromobacterium violaceum]|uniref:Flagellar rod assembly protein/muramidase FlgJ n=1 Tax=Chromobacterium violaceum TaxID=536 RepID=A0A447TFM5_CHRVL|nr:flagellar rod assembly protein/muramidase FlgJ [Chromobacterium violaceum]
MTAKFQGLLPNDMLSRQLAADPTGLQKLKAKASGDPKAAAKEAASQFEALLMNTMLKTMRATKFDESEASNSLDTFQGLSTSRWSRPCARAAASAWAT